MEGGVNGRVSILTPCYNGERFVARCLKSVLSQNYDNIEMIIVDDGSKDNSKEAILAFSEKFEQRGYYLKYLNQPNSGQGAAFNNAIKYFSGEFLFALDIDDFLMPTIIKELCDTLKNNPDYAIVRCNGYCVDNQQNDTVLSKYVTTDKMLKINTVKNIFKGLLKGEVNNWGGSYMIRASAFLEQSPQREIFPSRYGQHLQLLLPVAYFNKALFIDKPLARYCRNIPGSHSCNSCNDLGRRLEMMDGYTRIRLETIKRLNISLKDKKKWLGYTAKFNLRTRILIAIDHNNYDYMRKELFKGIKNSSISPKFLLKCLLEIIRK